MKFTRQKMVGWFDFGQLFHTAIKTVVSSAFGNYADKREMQAALGQEEKESVFYDCSGSDEVWVDYISDLGDGFDPTYTVAHLLGKPFLQINDQVLPQAKILILGGDQVYPTPEMVEYNNRFRGPYKAAFPDVEYDPTIKEDPLDRSLDRRTILGEETRVPAKDKFPWMFAVPGNHDWYDGLTNFIKIFTQERRIGNWQTIQKRSYFAIKLPHDCWVWGIDVQLDSDIDYPQCKYFEQIAKAMKNGSKIILCTAEPVWVFKATQKKNTSYDRLDYFVRSYIENDKGWIGPKGEFCHQLLATLTGDLHHYSHYSQVRETWRGPNHLITAGGGGTFLHPTHNLPETLTGLEEAPLAGQKPSLPPNLEAVFPPKATSQRLLLGNFLFPIKSWQFTVLMGIFYALFAWLAQSNTHLPGSNGETSNTFFENIALFAADGYGFWQWLLQMLKAWLLNPMILILLVAVGAGLYKFTDANGTKKSYVGFIGALHAVVQLLSVFLVIWNLVKFNPQFFAILGLGDGNADGWWKALLFAVEIFVVGGVVGALIMGAYLYITNRLFDIHLTESFSGLAIEDYKNLLRIHVEKGRVTIYPVGIPHVTKDWRNISPDPKQPKFMGTEPNIQLIEPPIVISF